MGKSQPPPPQQPPASVKDTVYKLQLALLDGVKTLDHLYLAGSIISRSDYNDVVTERTIADHCGYPLCPNALPPESSRPRKGHYRISLKEHKVYDLHETYMYCSSSCLIESKAFVQSLSEERCDVLDYGKVERVLRAFVDVDFEKGEVVLGDIRDFEVEDQRKERSGQWGFGISKLKIEEKSEVQLGDVGVVGPSNAIEGYVPHNQRISKPLGSKKSKKVSSAGIILLPRPDGVVEEEPNEDVDMLEPEQAPMQPRNPGIPNFDLFDSEDTWFDDPPEGFSLTLSPFLTMGNSLFTWITSSTLAYIYGRDERFHEEFLSINGKEYPRKIVLAGGHSSEIKKTLAESLARTLPGVVSQLRLPTPVSSLEQEMSRMLGTMTFVDALPAFRMKQWKVVVLLFLEGLSVCRIPALGPCMRDRRMLFHKVLDGSEITAEHYELMKDHIIPLGRAPKFSAQSGA